MSQACPKCGTMLDAYPVDGPNHHTPTICRDVLHAKLEERTRERDEAIDLALHLMIDHAPNFRDTDAALERLRSHGK